MSVPPVPLGTSDFRQLRQDESLYVDKTGLIIQVIEDPARVLLFPRPRRFGKTTNLTTLRYFLEKHPEERSGLFTDLAVWRSERARKHFQRHPVIFLTFKDIKKDSYALCQAEVAATIAELYKEHQYLLAGDRLDPKDAATFRALLAERASEPELQASLRRLSRHLAEHHGERVVVLLDEYDTPLHAAFSRGYFDEAVGLFRGLLSGVLKDNEHLFKGVLTGVLRVAKESFFSDLNNIIVYSSLSPHFASAFGFTEAEVADLVRRAGSPLPLDELRAWYNGYDFAGTVIYNPWSVLAALRHGVCGPYWVNTASNELLHELVVYASSEALAALELLLQGGTIRRRISESIVLRQVRSSTDALWSFLLFAGYLRASNVRLEEDLTVAGDLSLPNLEIRAAFGGLFRDWMTTGLGDDVEVERLGRALLSGDAEVFQDGLSRLLLGSVSSFDLAGNKLPPEQLYHVFVLGLLLSLQPRYQVRSNRESGRGRYDVMIIPRQAGQPGAVLELKVRGPRQSLATALREGVKQLAERGYEAELQAQGAAPIHQLAVAFDGKDVRVRALARPSRARKGPGRARVGR